MYSIHKKSGPFKGKRSRHDDWRNETVGISHTQTERDGKRQLVAARTIKKDDMKGNGK